MPPVRMGCSGWNYPHWRTPVYEGTPQRLWLSRYAEVFSTVEVNSSFYRLPAVTTTRAWAEQTPDGFLFAVKVSRYATHIRRLDDAGGRCDELLERLQPIVDAGKLGPLLWQLPESFHRDDDRLAAAVAAFPRPHRHCIEFRHPSWFCGEVMNILRGAGVALVIGDHPERPFQTEEWTADWTYLRFHYGSRGVRGNYSRGELKTWARKLRRWRDRGDVYAYFNNDWEAFAVNNAQQLADMSGSVASGSRAA
jgi:uncharacterized protein YecE (DUF72 family)